MTVRTLEKENKKLGSQAKHNRNEQNHSLEGGKSKRQI